MSFFNALVQSHPGGELFVEDPNGAERWPLSKALAGYPKGAQVPGDYVNIKSKWRLAVEKGHGNSWNSLEQGRFWGKLLWIYRCFMEKQLVMDDFRYDLLWVCCSSGPKQQLQVRYKSAHL